MPRRPCYWTRKLELDLVEFVRRRHFIWQATGNTNHQIQRKYKAYAEFAAKIGRGFSARSVRDRWVNIRCTFNHNLRRVEKSRQKAKSDADIYVPCWPLWKPLQFLCEASLKAVEPITLNEYPEGVDQSSISPDLQLRQRVSHDTKTHKLRNSHNKCVKLLDDIITSMQPLQNTVQQTNQQMFWFFSKHVTERLNAMSFVNAESASAEIKDILECWSRKNGLT